jgi:TrmH family RNA methyltransferase
LRRLLGRRSSRLEEGAYVVEGATLVADALTAGADIEAIYTAHDAAAYDGRSVPVHMLGRGVIERVATTKNAQSVLAVVRLRPPPSDLLASASFVVAVDRVADPGNLGTILRSAEAAGVDAVTLTEGTVDPYNPKVVRAAAGALFRVPVFTAVAPGDLRRVGLQLVGTSSHHGVAYTDASFEGRLALVFGSEAHGLGDDAPVDEWVRIPHRGRAESLNVAMAATLLTFEVARRRIRSGSVERAD